MADGAPIIVRKKKVVAAHAHHGGSWKVAYADFVTAMMAFFMVMWIMGLSDQTKAQIQGYFKDPFGLIKSEPASSKIFNIQTAPPESRPQVQSASNASQKDRDQIKQLREDISHKLMSDAKIRSIMKNVVLKITPEGLRIELVESADTAFFKTGSAVLNPAALEVTSRLSPLLTHSHRQIIVEGHTDSRPYPSSNYTNWDLSSDRANALLKNLVADYVPPSQFKGVRALADTDLEIPSRPFDPRNRRVSILLPYITPEEFSDILPKDEVKASMINPAKG